MSRLNNIFNRISSPRARASPKQSTVSLDDEEPIEKLNGTHPERFSHVVCHDG